MVSERFNNIMVRLGQIRPGRVQFRRTTGFDAPSLNELGQSIKKRGIINPPMVYQHDDLFLLHAGERRWRARCLIALVESGWYTWTEALEVVSSSTAREDLIKLRHLFNDVFIEVRLSLSESFDWALSIIENGHRANLKPSEEAEGYQLLVAQGYSVAEIADLADKPEATVNALILSMQLEPEIQELIDQGHLPKGLEPIRALLSVEDSRVRLGIARRVAAFEKGEVNKGDLLRNICKAYHRSANLAGRNGNGQDGHTAGNAPTNGERSTNGTVANPRTNGNGVVSIDQVTAIHLYTPPPHQFDRLCLGCTDAILALMEECCNGCLVNEFTAKCLQCEGFVTFAQLLLQELHHRRMNFTEEDARQSGPRKGKRRGTAREESCVPETCSR